MSKSILLLGFILIVALGYILFSNKNLQLQLLSMAPFPTSIHKNTTMGVALMPPDGWLICDHFGNDILLVKVEEGDACKGRYSDSLHINIGSGTLTNPVDRKQEESFMDWVQRFSKADTAYLKEYNPPGIVSSEFITINPFTILEKRTGNLERPHPYPPEEIRQHILYIEDKNPLKVNIHIIADDKNDEILKILAKDHIASIPITTGAIALWDPPHIKPDFQGTIYKEDKKTIAATFSLNSAGRFLLHLQPGSYYYKSVKGELKPITVTLGKIITYHPD